LPLSSLILVLTAAVLHALWNFVLKRTGERFLVAWWALAIGSLIYMPLFLFFPVIPVEIWPYAISSGLVETFYMIALIGAYSLADFSLVYPLARGTAPLLLAVGAAVFLGERLNLHGYTGLVVLLAGLFVIAAGPFWNGERGRLSDWKGVAASLLVSVFVATYSTIDAAAVQLMNPITYNALMLALMSAFLAPVIFKKYGVRRVIETGRKDWPRFLVIGFLLVLTYMLVLIAYSRGNVSYAGALREVSVVIGAFVGWKLLGEKMGKVRLFGSAIIFIGIFLIASAG